MGWQAAQLDERQQRLVPAQGVEMPDNLVGEAALRIRRKREE